MSAWTILWRTVEAVVVLTLFVIMWVTAVITLTGPQMRRPIDILDATSRDLPVAEDCGCVPGWLCRRHLVETHEPDTLDHQER